MTTKEPRDFCLHCEIVRLAHRLEANPNRDITDVLGQIAAAVVDLIQEQASGFAEIPLREHFKKALMFHQAWNNRKLAEDEASAWELADFLCGAASPVVPEDSRDGEEPAPVRQPPKIVGKSAKITVADGLANPLHNVVSISDFKGLKNDE